MTEARFDAAVWAAIYVRVLFATPPSYPDDDHNQHGQAAVLGGPTSARKIAAAAADNAVVRLVEGTANR